MEKKKGLSAAFNAACYYAQLPLRYYKDMWSVNKRHFGTKAAVLGYGYSAARTMMTAFAAAGFTFSAVPDPYKPISGAAAFAVTAGYAIPTANTLIGGQAYKRLPKGLNANEMTLFKPRDLDASKTLPDPSAPAPV